MKLEELLENPQISKKLVKKIMFLIAFTIFFIYAVFHLSGLLAIVKQAIAIVSPFLIGIVIAFVLNVLVKLFEERVFQFLNVKKHPVWIKCRRGVCILIVVILMFVFLGLIAFLIVPELTRSISTLTSTAPVYAKQFQNWIMKLLSNLNITPELMGEVQKLFDKIDWPTIISSITNVTTNFVGSVVTVTVGVTSGIINFVMSFIFAIYMLFQKENLIHNLKRVLYAFLPERIAKKSIEVGSLSNRIFAGFVSGQCTEALIIGILCYLGMSLMGLPYALLISTVVAITSVIPIFGAYIGAIFGGFILLLVKPLYCLMFVIYIIILQNVEGNLIYPRVVGNSVGLPGIWVMLSIFVCGDLFGFIGVLLGVPVFSILYTLLKGATNKKLLKKNISNREIVANQIGIPPELVKTEIIQETISTADYLQEAEKNKKEEDTEK